MDEWRKPYRILVIAHGILMTGKSRNRKPTPTTYGYFGWTPIQSYREARLPSSGSFLYPGIVAVRKAAMEYLSQPEVTQVQIRTNQDRKVYLWNKHKDGRISGYAPSND